MRNAVAVLTGGGSIWVVGHRVDQLPNALIAKEINLDTPDEVAANDAFHDALKALQRARELSLRAGYGSLVVVPLAEAQRETQYAFDTARERN
ncbi:hypothetical protein [Massilia soli]|uniref:hypothetical protein n=1 Tax=Massilia soli TaxID=2792854 RepID=UPI001CBFDE5A|nr:hypothetical protein [Massilia soli]